MQDYNYRFTSQYTDLFYTHSQGRMLEASFKVFQIRYLSNQWFKSIICKSYIRIKIFHKSRILIVIFEIFGSRLPFLIIIPNTVLSFTIILFYLLKMNYCFRMRSSTTLTGLVTSSTKKIHQEESMKRLSIFWSTWSTAQ